MPEPTFDTWPALRAAALARDASRCTLARLFGGRCSPTLHAHHLVPVSAGGPELPPLDGVLTACARHHPMLEATRREVLRRRAPRRCPHFHPYPEGRRACERKLARVLL